MTSVSSPTLMTCVSSVPQNVWSPSSSSSNRLRRSTHESRPTWVRPKCGTASAIFRLDVMPCRRLPNDWTQTQEADEAKDLKGKRRSVSWASRSVSFTSWRPSSVQPQTSTAFRANESCAFRIFRVRGSFSSLVPTHETRILSQASHLSKRLSSLRPMMTRLDFASALLGLPFVLCFRRLWVASSNEVKGPSPLG